jgi:hypothetical protein
MKTDAAVRFKTKDKVKKFGPGSKQGKRNIFCPFYSQCLDFAIQQQWLSWNCRNCEHMLNESAKADILAGREDSIPYYEVAMPF